MKIDVVTLFPKTLKDIFTISILKIAQEKKLIEINVLDLRKFGKGKRKTVDDRPFGGGTGMILRVDVLVDALKFLTKDSRGRDKPFVILTDPTGTTFNQKLAKKLSKKKWLVIFCGHYEGVDERFKKWVDISLSIGDYILTGGELPAAVIVDATSRLVTNVLKREATATETFSEIKVGKEKIPILEYPQYSRPRTFLNLEVPPVLISGDHKRVEEWRIREALTKTKKSRPDLLR